MKRIRLGTLLAWVAIFAMALALVIHQRRAARREARLLSVLALYRDRAQETIIDELEQPVILPYPRDAPLEDVLKSIKARSRGRSLPKGFPIYVDPLGLQEAGLTLTAPVRTMSTAEPLPFRVHLERILKPMGLGHQVDGGLLVITSEEAVDVPLETDLYQRYRDVLK